MLQPDMGKMLYLGIGAILGMWVLPRFLSR